MIRTYCDDFAHALAPGVELSPPYSAAAAGGAAAGAAAAPRDKVSVVLVTGGGTGIGKAVALRLAKGGWQKEGNHVAVVLTGRRGKHGGSWRLSRTLKVACSECRALRPCTARAFRRPPMRLLRWSQSVVRQGAHLVCLLREHILINCRCRFQP
eukprot:6177302-Pleurochrysis_carterae.AAC.1